MSKLYPDKKMQIRLLQDNLPSLRKIAGWTVEELGNRIGVSKMTISNLENRKTTMSFTQYIAIRAVLDCEIQTYPDNSALANAIDILLDQDEPLSDAQYEQIQLAINQVAAAASGGIKGDALDDTFTKLTAPLLLSMGLSTVLLPAVGVSTAIAGRMGLSWLQKILNHTSSNKTDDDK